jgi:hypothetical protein
VEDASIWLTSCLYTSGGPFNGNEPVYQLNPFGGTVQLMQGDVAIGIAASPEGSVWATSIE